MKIIDIPGGQGSLAWHQHRRDHWNASDSPAMMGCSPYKTRTALLQESHSGLAPEVDGATQRLYDSGHQFEAWARPLAESIVGEDLYPLVKANGKLSASLDGHTLMGDADWEHKSLNDELRAAMPLGAVAGPEVGAALPLMYRVQMAHQHHCSGAQRTLFTASKWDAAGNLIEARHCWYHRDEALIAQVLAGWKQFEADLAAFVPQAATVQVVGKTMQTLPALRIEVTGAVTASNLDAFKSHALQVFKDIKTDLQTDQDFADAEKTVKWCGDVEDRLQAAKQHALSQTESIDALFRAIDEIAAEAKAKRLHLDKVVKARKESIRGEIVAEGVTALAAHIRGLNERIGKAYMPPPAADFGGAIKGKRTVASLRDAVNTTLAAAKIAANETADRITLNLKALAEHEQHASLFPDEAAIALKPRDDFAALVKARISDHQERERLAQEARDKAAEAQRKADEEIEDSLVASIQRYANGVEADASPYIRKAIETFELAARDFEQDPRQRVIDAIAAGRRKLTDQLASAEKREAEAAQQSANTPAAPVATAAAILGTAETPEPGTLEAAPTTLEEAALAYGTAAVEYDTYFKRRVAEHETELCKVNPAPHAAQPLCATPTVTVQIGVNGLTEDETEATASCFGLMSTTSEAAPQQATEPVIVLHARDVPPVIAGKTATMAIIDELPELITDEAAAADIASRDFGGLGPEDQDDDEGGIDAKPTDAIRDRALDLKALIDQARSSKFPKQPKMGPEWFAALYAAVDALAVAAGVA